MGRKRRQWDTTPQKTSSNMIEDWVESEGDDSPIADFRRMTIRMFHELNEELKENMQKQLNEYPMPVINGNT
jgi:hypothetical protein